jgi:hypothetical protein
MKLSRKMIASCAGIAVLVAAVVAFFTLLNGNGAMSPAPAQAAVAPVAVTNGETAEPLVVMTADFAVSYTSLAQLARAASTVVRGEVVDVSYLDFNSSAYTKVTLKVGKCLKGDIAADDEITILEVGGITTMAAVKGDKFGPTTKEDADTKVKMLLDGAPLTQAGEKCLYFLGKGNIGVVAGAYYVPMGCFQGQFKIDSGVAKRFVPADWKDSKYTSLAMDENTVDNSLSQAAVQ